MVHHSVYFIESLILNELFFLVMTKNEFIQNFQICELSGRTCGYKFMIHFVEFEEFIIKKIMNQGQYSGFVRVTFDSPNSDLNPNMVLSP
jgi:hypothetical protein